MILDGLIKEVGGPEAALTTRVFSAQQEGFNDVPVRIWVDNGWRAAWFKDIEQGDFYLLQHGGLMDGRCFRAASKCLQCGRDGKGPTFIIKRGSEIVQAPTAPTTESEYHELEPSRIRSD